MTTTGRIVAAFAGVMILTVSFLLFMHTGIAGIPASVLVYTGALALIGVLLIVFLLFQEKLDPGMRLKKKQEERTQEQKISDKKIEEENSSDELKAQAEELRRLLLKASSDQKACEIILHYMARLCNAAQGALFRTHVSDGKRKLVFVAGYAYSLPDSVQMEFEFGEGLPGQAAKDKQRFVLSGTKVENASVFSGLGNAVAEHLIVQPVVHGEEVLGVIELSSFSPFDNGHEAFADSINPILAEKLGMLKQ